MSTKVLLLVALAPMMLSGCFHSQSANVNADGSADVQGFNIGIQAGLPFGSYSLHLQDGEWFRDSAGVIKRK